MAEPDIRQFSPNALREIQRDHTRLKSLVTNLTRRQRVYDSMDSEPIRTITGITSTSAINPTYPTSGNTYVVKLNDYYFTEATGANSRTSAGTSTQYVIARTWDGSSVAQNTPVICDLIECRGHGFRWWIRPAAGSGSTIPFLWLTNFGRLLASGSGSPASNEVSAARYGAIYFQSVYNDPAAAEIEILTESAATVDDCALRITADGLYKITARFTGVDNTSYVDEDYMYDTGTVDGIDTWHHATPNSTISRKDTDDNWTALTSIVGHRNIFGGYANSAGAPPASSLTQVDYADDWLQGYGETYANLSEGDELWFGMGYLASTHIASTAVKFAINSYDVEIVRIGSQVTPTSYTL